MNDMFFRASVRHTWDRTEKGTVPFTRAKMRGNPKMSMLQFFLLSCNAGPNDDDGEDNITQ